MVSFHHIGGDINPADVLSKHWGHSQVHPTLQPLLFCKGDALDLIEIKDQGNNLNPRSATIKKGHSHYKPMEAEHSCVTPAVANPETAALQCQ